MMCLEHSVIFTVFLFSVQIARNIVVPRSQPYISCVCEQNDISFFSYTALV